MRGCTACTAARPPAFRVLGEGPVDARIVLVGEAPGATEEAEGRPFVGDAGGELDLWLLAAGVDRQRVRIVNALACRPTKPGKRPGTLRNRSPRTTEAAACREHLQQQIGLVRPWAVLTVGAVALSSVAPELTIAGVDPQGVILAPRDQASPLFGVRLFALYHPAAVLRWHHAAPPRAQEARARAVDALRAAARFVEVNSPEPRLGEGARHG